LITAFPGGLSIYFPNYIADKIRELGCVARQTPQVETEFRLV
jgi:hypothetical protein